MWWKASISIKAGFFVEVPTSSKKLTLDIIMQKGLFSFFLTSTNCLFPNDQWMSATFQMIYFLKDEKLLGNRSSNNFIWDWNRKRGKKDGPLYFPHGIHKFDFPIWIQKGKSTLAEILRFQSDNCRMRILDSFIIKAFYKIYYWDKIVKISDADLIE